MKTLQTVKRYIAKNRLLDEGGSLVAGLSGGADSVVMLFVLNRLGYRCTAAHCNFHLRGAESERDEHFAADFAASLGLPFVKADFDARAEAEKRGISIEMAARELRYRWFEEIRQRENASAIAVAHHSGDSVETVLLNLIRSTGISGLTGIRPRNGFIIRPLLCLTKQKILDFAKAENLDFVTDSTNLEDEFTRNKIRLQVIPLLETLNPSVKEAVLQTAGNLAEAEKVISAELLKARNSAFDAENGLIDIARLKNFSSPELLLFDILKDYGFNRETLIDIENALDSRSGKEFFSPSHRLVKDRGKLILTKRKVAVNKEFTIEKETSMIEIPHFFNIKLEKKERENFAIDKSKSAACLDFDKLQFPLTLRKWQAGDKFKPLGMNGFQKLSDFFNNNKISIPEKENIWVLTSGADIVWIVGFRIDERYKMTEKTKNIFFLKILRK
ncbi:MAG: tRNA lysidine(34) synthetase TilS [Dysgonamonadaceae bacterium]|jgi:tRNA(Ile)-lysidine synthase|nr:tRNA lysidine(34) synthetase TilS [Dysgonamonadaceae bacterium]